MQLKDVAPSYGVAFASALSVYFLKFLPISYWLVLPVQILVGTIVFFIVCEKMKLGEYMELKHMALSLIKKLKNK